MIYLDNAATTYPKPEEVYIALDNANRNLAFNAGRGGYVEAQNVSDMIKETKQMVAELIGLDGNTVSFESSATEALNLIINGLEFNEGDAVYVSPFEHNAIMRPLHYLETNKGITIKVIPFDKKTWKLKTSELMNMFALEEPKAVFLSHISNVTGYILPYEEIFELSKQFNAVNVLDCSQSYGVINPNRKDVDFVVFAGHKSLYASFGIAGFINVTSTRLDVYKSGGTGSDSLNLEMPESGSGRYEAGSSNSIAIAGLNASLKWLKTVNVYKHEKALTEKLISELRELDNINIFVPEDTGSIFGVVSISVPNYSPEDVGTILAEECGICVRTGYHCSPFVHEFIGSMDSLGTVRISLSYFSTEEEIHKCAEAICSL